MELKEAIRLAGGATVVARACSITLAKPITRFAVYRWIKNNKLPRSEWYGTTQYALAISNLAKVLGHEIEPIDLCPGAGQYMESTKKDMRKMEANQ